MESAKISCSWQNTYNQAAAWLITISVRTEHGWEGGGDLRAAYPQSRAVVDDFGTLVCVKGWA